MTEPRPFRVHAPRHTYLVTFDQLPVGRRVPVGRRADQVEQIYAAARDRRNWLDA